MLNPSSTTFSSSNTIIMSHCIRQDTKDPSLSGNAALPIPVHFPGFTFSSSLNQERQNEIPIEAFLDLQCPNSKRIFPVLLALAQSEPRVRLTIVPIVLPAHRQAFGMTKSVVAASLNDNKINDNLAIEFIKLLYDRLEEFSDPIYAKKTGDELIRHLAILVAEFQHLSTASDIESIENVLHSDKLEGLAKSCHRLSVKRGVCIVPSVFINSVEVITLDSRASLEDLRAIILQLSS